MLIYQNAFFQPGHAISSMQAIRSCHNVVKEPICTLSWQSPPPDQLKYLQIENLRVNHNPLFFFAILVLLHPPSGYSETQFYFVIHSEIAEIHVSGIIKR